MRLRRRFALWCVKVLGLVVGSAMALWFAMVLLALAEEYPLGPLG